MIENNWTGQNMNVNLVMKYFHVAIPLTCRKFSIIFQALVIHLGN